MRPSCPPRSTARLQSCSPEPVLRYPTAMRSSRNRPPRTLRPSGLPQFEGKPGAQWIRAVRREVLLGFKHAVQGQCFGVPQLWDRAGTGCLELSAAAACHHYPCKPWPKVARGAQVAAVSRRTGQLPLPARVGWGRQVVAAPSQDLGRGPVDCEPGALKSSSMQGLDPVGTARHQPGDLAHDRLDLFR